MKGIALVAVDLDGTLLTSAGSPAPDGARLLRQAARGGMHVVPATTRNPDSVQPLCRLLGVGGPIICSNGAQVWASPEGPVWACHTIPTEAALSIARLADVQGWELSTTVGPMTYWRQRPGQALGQIAPHIAVVAANADAVKGEPLRILAWQPEAIDGIRSLVQAQLSGQCYVETFYGPDGAAQSLGVFPSGADKGTGLSLVLERLGIAPEQVMAIGDHFNDLPMFRYARISVAMGNAPEEVKRKADVVAPNNDQEGVAWALKEIAGIQAPEG